MTNFRITSRWWGKHLLLAAFWTGAALLYVGMRFLAPALVGGEIPDWTLQRWGILGWMMWIPMTYIAVGFARLFPLNTSRWPVYGPLHIVGAVVCSSIGGLLFVSLIWVLTGGDISFLDRLQRTFIFAVPIDSIIYFAVLSGVYGFDYYRLHEAAQRRTERLRAELAEAELTTLRTQLNPHFLFNALNTVAAHIRENAAEAVNMLDRYLAIQRIRFGEEMHVTVTVDPDAADAQVPSLVLQPLVENAIHHGIRARHGSGRIWVTAHRSADTVRLCVMDNGQGPQMSGTALTRRGIGLDNVERRLRCLFGRQYTLALGRKEHDGTTVTAVTIEVPYHMEAPVVAGRGDGQAVRPPTHADVQLSPSP